MLKKFTEYVESLNENDSSKKDSGEKKEGSCKVVFITKNPKRESFDGEYSKFKKSCDKYGVDIYPVDIDEIKYKEEDGKITIDGVGEFTKDDTIFIFRHAVRIKSTDEEKEISQKNVKALKKLLKEKDFCLLNDPKVSSICKDKFKTFDTLDKAGVDTVKTYLLDLDTFNSKHLKTVANIKKYISDLGLELPIIVKVVDGTQGIGVFKCNDDETMFSIIPYVVRREGKCIIQPFCEIDYDVRVNVFCKTLRPETADTDDFIIVGNMKRDKVKDDFRTNFSLGGNITNYDLSKEEEELAKKAAKAIGAVWCGIDICYDKISKKNYVIEVNSSPDIKGVSSVNDTKPSDIMVKCIKETLGKKK